MLYSITVRLPGHKPGGKNYEEWIVEAEDYFSLDGWYELPLALHTAAIKRSEECSVKWGNRIVDVEVARYFPARFGLDEGVEETSCVYSVLLVWSWLAGTDQLPAHCWGKS